MPKFKDSDVTDFFKKSQIEIGLYGFKTPADLILFLKTPAGASVQQKMQQAILTKEAFEKEKKFEQQEALKQKLRFLAFALLEAIYEKKAHAAEVAEASVEKREELKEKIQEKAEKAQEARLAESKEPIPEDTAVKEPEPQVQSIEEATQEIESHEKKHDDRSNKFNHLDERYENKSDEEIQKHLNKYETKNKATSEALKNEKDPEKKRELQEKLAKRALKSSHLNELLNKNNLNFLDKDLNPTNNKEAFYAVPKAKKIVSHEGELYLLNEGQKIDSLNEEDKKAAQKNYEALRPTLLSTRQLAKENREEELKALHENHQKLMAAHHLPEIAQEKHKKAAEIQRKNNPEELIEHFKNNIKELKARPSPAPSDEKTTEEINKDIRDAEKTAGSVYSSKSRNPNLDAPMGTTQSDIRESQESSPTPRPK